MANNIIQLKEKYRRPGGTSYRAEQLSLIQRTIAKDLNANEFELFIALCERRGLDPLTGQVYCMVTSRNDEDKRKLVLMSAIDGLRSMVYRAVAERGVEARPDEKEPIFEIDPSLISETNPAGLIKAVVTWHVSDKRGNWHPVTAAAKWEEFVPLWYDRKKDTTEIKFGTQWAKMPTLMLAKCAEAGVLRRIAPEALSGLYAPEEMDQDEAREESAWALAEGAAEQKRLERAGVARTIPLLLTGDWKVQGIPVGEFADKFLANLKQFEHCGDALAFIDSNAHGLREFWAVATNDALELKREREKIVAKLSQAG